MLGILADVSSGDVAGAGIAVGLLLVFLLVGLVLLVWYIWLLVDMLKYPDPAWTSSGQNKQLWIILWVVGLCTQFALIIGLIYQFAIRPKVRQAAGMG